MWSIGTLPFCYGQASPKVVVTPPHARVYPDTKCLTLIMTAQFLTRLAGPVMVNVSLSSRSCSPSISFTRLCSFQHQKSMASNARSFLRCWILMQVRVPTNIVSSICDDRGEEPTYNGVDMSTLIRGDYSVGDVISLLWFKRSLPKYATRFIDMCIMLCADHGPCVSGKAHGRSFLHVCMAPHSRCSCASEGSCPAAVYPPNGAFYVRV